MTEKATKLEPLARCNTVAVNRHKNHTYEDGETSFFASLILLGKVTNNSMNAKTNAKTKIFSPGGFDLTVADVGDFDYFYDCFFRN